MLLVKDLYKAFGEKAVLANLNLEIPEGKIFTLTGANGSGKTTLFNILTGFLKADKGNIRFKGRIMNGLSPAARNRLGISRTFQDLRLIRQLTVKENIILAFRDNPGENLMNAMLPKKFLKKYYDEFESKADAILEQVFLEDVAGSLAGEISYGQQKLLTLGCCIAGNPDLLLLDEPTAGVNIEYQGRIKMLLEGMKSEGKTVLLIDHNPDFIDSVSDGIMFLHEGSVTKFINYNEFKNNSFVKSAYL